MNDAPAPVLARLDPRATLAIAGAASGAAGFGLTLLLPLPEWASAVATVLLPPLPFAVVLAVVLWLHLRLGPARLAAFAVAVLVSWSVAFLAAYEPLTSAAWDAALASKPTTVHGVSFAGVIGISGLVGTVILLLPFWFQFRRTIRLSDALLTVTVAAGVAYAVAAIAMLGEAEAASSIRTQDQAMLLLACLWQGAVGAMLGRIVRRGDA